MTVNIIDVNDIPVICTDLTTQGAAGCTKAVTGFEMYGEKRCFIPFITLLIYLHYHIYTYVHLIYMYTHHIYTICTPNTPLNTL